MVHLQSHQSVLQLVVLCMSTHLCISAFSKPQTLFVAHNNAQRTLHHRGATPLQNQKLIRIPDAHPKPSSTVLHFEGKGDYYGESDSSYMIREFSMFDQLKEVVKLASQELPERPDGIVTVAKFTSANRADCRATEAEYERLARKHPDTIFLRCFEEYENADMLLGQAQVSALPTFDVFHGGNRVGRIEGSDYELVEKYITSYGVINSKLDLFSEQAGDSLQPWGSGTKYNAAKTPRTTARFIPGYDWNSKKGFFDAAADKAMENFEGMYENWVPEVEDK